MNLVNRVLIIMELLAAMALSILLIVLTLFNPAAIRQTLDPVVSALMPSPGNPAPVIFVGILFLVFAFSVLLLILELYRPGPSRLRLQSIQGAEVLVTADAVTQQLEYTLDALTDVIRVKPRVATGGKNHALDVFVELWTTADVDLQAKTQEIMGVTHQVIEDKLGLKVGKVQIKIDQVKSPNKTKKPTLVPLSSAPVKVPDNGGDQV